ncbi:MAG TPA: glycosyltransferase family 4 protein [Candidatus Paceibacterota bacterium]
MYVVNARILMFGWEFPPHHSGGLGVACQGITKALAERGFEVLFVMPKKLDVSSPYARFLFADEHVYVTVRALDSVLTPYLTSRNYPKGRAGSIYGHDLFEEVMRYASLGGEIAKEEQFDIIYAHDWLAFGAGIEAKKATGKPLIVHVHATEYDRCGGMQGINEQVFEIEQRGMREADRVIAVSEYTKGIIVREYGIPATKVFVVYNGIDESTTPKGDSTRKMRSLRQDGYKIVLFLGRLTLQKGPDYLLRAAKRVLERNPKVFFVISGAGDMEEHVMRMAAELGIAGNVIFTGFLSGDDRHEMYTAADVFVMPSVSEPFGISPLEAMKLGVPVIVTKQSGVAEVVRNALKMDFWDTDEMAAKILAVVGYPALGATLSFHGKNEAERLTWQRAGEKIEFLVAELVH